LNRLLTEKKVKPGKDPVKPLSGIPQLLVLLFMIITLGIAVWSVDKAGWIRPATSLTLVMIIAALAAFLLVKSGLRSHFVFLLGLIVGLVVLFFQGILLMPGSGLVERVSQLISDLEIWWSAQIYGVPSPVTIHVAMIFGLLSWLTGFLSSWSLTRKNNPWLAVLLGTLIVLVNLNFWTRDHYYYFLAFAASALVFLALFNYLNNRSGEQERFLLRLKSPAIWAAASFGLITIILSIFWTNPGFRIDSIANYSREHSPFKGTIEVYWNSFFAPVPGSGVPLLIHGGQRDLNFGGSLELSDQVDFIISSPKSSYWKTQVYDIYNSNGWETSPTRDIVMDQGETAPAKNTQQKETLDYTITAQVKTDVIPTAGEYLNGDIETINRVFTPQVFRIELYKPESDSLLPPDIAQIANSMRSVRSSRRRSEQQLTALLPYSLKLENVIRQNNVIETILVSRNPTEDPLTVSVSSVETLKPQDDAEISVILPPELTRSDLEKVTADYPVYVTDRYLQLPDSLPERVRNLALTIVEGKNGPFEKAQAVKEHLAGYEYSLQIEAPPPEADGVDYFLFEQKAGYCNYFASAATVLLRSAGIPSRMVVGFLPGQYDSNSKSYIIRDRDYHAWTEVYYPQYGWIRLDATPGRGFPEFISTGSASYPEFQYPYPQFELPAVSPSSPSASSPVKPVNSNRNILIFMACYAIIVALVIFLFDISSKPKNRNSVYSRMLFLTALAGLGVKRSQTVMEFSEKLRRSFPHQSEEIDQITSTYLAWRYSRQEPSPSEYEKMLKRWPALRWAIIKRIFRIG